MRIIFRLFFFLASSTIIFLSASEILATVNGSDITKEEVNEFVVRSIPGMTYDSLSKGQQKGVVNKMIERKLFLEDAKRIHIEENPAYQKALQKLQENLLLDFWMKMKVEEIEISDQRAKESYYENIKQITQPASVKVRHILVPTAAEAVALIAELKKSKNLKKTFIEFAKEKSTGPSAVNGGEFDWFVYEQMVPEFSEAAFSLLKGKITQHPVQTQFGYHIIYLEDKKEKTTIPYKKVKPKIVQGLRIDRFKIKLEELSQKMKETAKIIVK